jgi:signal transduction histidine kinase
MSENSQQSPRHLELRRPSATDFGRHSAADALRAFYLGPFRPDLITASIDPHRLERQRRARLFTLIVTVLTLIQAGSLLGQIVTAAPTVVILAQCAALILGVVCLLLNRAGWTEIASVLYLSGSIAGVDFASTQTGAVLDLRGLLILSILFVFTVLSGLLLPRWAIWVIAAVCAFVALYALLTRPLGGDALVAGSTVAASEQTTRATLIGIFLVLLLSLATLTWIASRSTFAGLSTLAAAVEREQELTALKDLFIMDVNHELRTPIMTLYNNIEALELMRRLGADPNRQALALQRAHSAGDAVLHLLNTILDPTVVSGRVPPLKLEPVPIAALMQNILETFDPREVGESVVASPKDEPRPVHVHIGDGLVLLADVTRLRQILINLLANAVKYSSQGSAIEVTAQSVEESMVAPHHPLKAGLVASAARTEVEAMPMACIRIRDHGLGVPLGEQRKLFQRFVRLERDITGPVRGTGIGLYTCRTLVEAMGGMIWVESAGIPGDGSTFAFTLPRWPPGADGQADGQGVGPTANATNTAHAMG